MTPLSTNSFFLPYQARWICDNSRLKIMEKSRQIGLSWSAAYGSVRRQSLSSYRLDTWISSRDEIQAKLFILDCKIFVEIFENAARICGGAPLFHDGRASSLILAFANGTAIHSLSSTPDAQAGKRGHRILDEFALHADPKLLYSIALPGITWGGQLEIISTHRGTENFFNQLLEEIKFGGNPKQFSHHRVTLQDALDQGFLRKLKRKLPRDDERQQMDEAQYFDFIRSTCPNEELFQQEYMCRPADDRSAFLPYDLLIPCEYAGDESWEIAIPYVSALSETALNSECFLGIDVGRENDLTVFWLLEWVHGVLFTRKVECFYQQPFSLQERRLQEFLRLPKLRRVCIDQTGIGRQFAERIAEQFGSHRVEGVTFTPSTKESLAYGVRLAFEKCLLRIPADDEIRADLLSLRKEVTAAGNVRFAADRGKNGHGDRFWALALALHGFGNDVAQRPTIGDASVYFWQRKKPSYVL